MAFRPLGDRVVIRRVEEEAKTKGGIIIPDNAKEKPQEGEVVAVGPGARDEDGKRIAIDVAAGDRAERPGLHGELDPVAAQVGPQMAVGVGPACRHRGRSGLAGLRQ